MKIIDFKSLVPFVACLLGGCSTMTPSHEVLRVEGASFFGDTSKAAKHAVHLYREGQIERAADKFEQALQLQPNNGSVHNNLGLIRYEQRQLVAAADHFDAAINLLPDDPRPINGLGMTLEAGGQVMEAIELYLQASELARDNPLYLGNALRARSRMGESSDELVEQLRYLAFIETRPDWLAWTDEQLAIKHNPALDRGPAPPQLNRPRSLKTNGQAAAQVGDAALKQRGTTHTPIEAVPLELLPSYAPPVTSRKSSSLPAPSPRSETEYLPVPLPESHTPSKH